MNGKIFQNSGERSLISLTINKINLNPGQYTIEIAITAEGRREVLAKYQNIKTFQVTGQHFGFAPVQIMGDWKVSRNIHNDREV